MKNKWYVDSTGLKVEASQSSYKKCFEINRKDILNKTKDGLFFYTLRKTWVDKESYIESYLKLAKTQGIKTIKASFSITKGFRADLNIDVEKGSCKELLNTDVYKFPIIEVLVE